MLPQQRGGDVSFPRQGRFHQPTMFAARVADSNSVLGGESSIALDFIEEIGVGHNEAFRGGRGNQGHVKFLMPARPFRLNGISPRTMRSRTRSGRLGRN